MIALIDGDSIAFILGWVHKEHQNKEEMYKSIDEFLENMFILTGAAMYYGALASDTPCFRYDVYKVKPYKGNRPDLQEHMQFWRPVVSHYLKNQWKFDSLSGYEADDLVFHARQEITAGQQTADYIICSPDKDLRQIPGLHYDYHTSELCMISEEQAIYNFYKLMLEGDDTDNVAGIPGYGVKKAEAKLKPLYDSCASAKEYYDVVFEAYVRHFGKYYGEIIFNETYQTISLKMPEWERVISIHSIPKKQHPFDLLNNSTIE